MEKQDAKKVMQILSDAFPLVYGRMGEDQKISTMRLYYNMLKDYPTELVVNGLYNYIRKNENIPTVAGVIKEIDELIPHQTELELWAELVKALSGAYYHAEENYQKLPKQVQAWLGDAEQLRQLGQVDIEKLQTVTKGQFLKTIGKAEQTERVQIGGENMRLLTDDDK